MTHLLEDLTHTMVSSQLLEEIQRSLAFQVHYAAASI